MCQGSADILYTLDYEFYARNKKIKGSVNGRRTNPLKINLLNQIVEKQIVIFKIPLKFPKLNDGFQSLYFLTKLKRNKKSLEDNVYFLSNNNNKLSLYNKVKVDNILSQCNFFCCNIGLQFYKDISSPTLVLKNLQDVNEIFYYGFVKSSDNDKFYIGVISNYNGVSEYNVIMCPVKNWISNFSLTKYIPDTNNVIEFSKRFKEVPYNFKIVQCGKTNSTNFFKCGHIDQYHMPSVDIGYKCDIVLEFDEMFSNEIYYVNMSEPLNYQLSDLDKNFLDPQYVTFLLLLPRFNNEMNLKKFDVYTNNSKFFSGQQLATNRNFYYSEGNIKYIFEFGRNDMYILFKYRLPEINATLRFKINGIVQKFKSRKNDDYEEIDTYIIDKEDINDIPVGCHAVPDEFKQPAFEDFYKYRFKTSLLVLNEATRQYEEIYSLKSMLPNTRYKCVLNLDNTKIKYDKSDHIKETVFVIELIDLIDPWFYIWVFFGIFIAVTVLLIVGLIIFKKIQLKKKKSNNSLSTSLSNSSQSSTISSIVKTNNLHVPIIQNKLVKAETKNNTSNIATKKSNNYNQIKNTPKKAIAKITNQKSNKKMGDSVFQLR